MEQDELDSSLLTLIEKCGGDSKLVLSVFFDFLSRRTDFFRVGARRRGSAKPSEAPQGSLQDPEEILLETFRRFKASNGRTSSRETYRGSPVDGSPGAIIKHPSYVTTKADSKIAVVDCP